MGRQVYAGKQLAEPIHDPHFTNKKHETEDGTSSLPLECLPVICPSCFSHFICKLNVDNTLLVQYLGSALLTGEICFQFQFSHVHLFVALCTCQDFLSSTVRVTEEDRTSIDSVMPSNHSILCWSILLLPSIFPQHQDVFQ